MNVSAIRDAIAHAHMRIREEERAVRITGDYCAGSSDHRFATTELARLHALVARLEARLTGTPEGGTR
jgi:hypothetical protein